MNRTKKNKNNIDEGLLVNRKGLPSLDLIMVIFIPVLIVITALLIKFALHLSMDSDPLWSIAVGEWINTHRTVPYIDVFSWTVAGEQWYSNSWLFCWLIYLADQYLGYFGPVLLIFIPYLVTGYFLYMMCKKYYDSTFSVMVFLTGVSMLILFSATPRAYIYTYAFIAVIMYLLRFKRDSKLIYIIPLIFLIWANMQSSMKFGIAILFIEALAGTIFFKDRKLWIVAILSFFATLINPYGFSFWDISFSGFFDLGSQYITEWRAPDFNHTGILVLYFFMFLTGILGVFRLKDDWDNKVFDRDKIMILFWFWAALLYSLNTVRAMQYVLLLLAPYFTAFVTKSPTENRFFKPVIFVVVLILFVSSLAYSLPLFPLELDPHTGRPVSFVDYLLANPTLYDKVSFIIPADAVNYLEENPAMSDRLFNSFIFGGYLLIKNIEVFIDARSSVFLSHNVFEDYMKITNVAVKPETIIEKYGIKTFLLSKGERLVIYLEAIPEWEKVYEDHTTVIFTNVGLE